MADLTDLKTKESELRSQLAGSSTAYAGNTTPTSSDQLTEVRLRALKDQMSYVRDQNLKERWAFNNPEQPGVKQEGLISRGLKGLMVPLHAVVGATESMLGKGAKPGMWENINENVMEGERTYADLLKRYGAPGFVSGPTGLMLDFMMDPVAWATLGTSALVPRVAVGLTKGGVKGAALGAKSSLLQKGSRVASGLSKVAPGLKDSAVYTKMIDKSFDTSMDYAKMVGSGLGQVEDASWYRTFIKDTARRAESQLPKGAVDAFKYSNHNWHEVANMRDEFLNSIKAAGVSSDDDARAIMKRFANNESYDDILEELAKKKQAKRLKNAGAGDLEAALNSTEETKEDLDRARELLARILPKEKVDDIFNVVTDNAAASDIALDPVKYVTADAVENAARLTAENAAGGKIALEDLRAALKSGLSDETGVKFVDDAFDTIRNFKKTIKIRDKEITLRGEKVLDAYRAYITGFKLSKVGASPSAWMNSVVGNAAMAHMSGLDISSSAFRKYVTESFKTMYSRSESSIVLQDLLLDPQIAQYLERYGGTFTNVVGTSPAQFAYKFRIDSAIKEGKNLGLIDDTLANPEIKQQMADALAEFNKVNKKGELLKDAGSTALKNISKDGQIVDRSQLATTMRSQEFLDSSMANRLMKDLSDKVAAGTANAGEKTLNFILNTMPGGYEKIDQSWRLGTFLYLTKHGISDKERRILTRFMEIPEEAFSTPFNVNGIPRVRIDPKYALEAASMIYLNYAAMPGAVKVLRQLPLLGSPFMSFMYGMAYKTGQTALYNPSAFNRISIAMNDLGGTPTPLERQTLESPYYSRLKDRAMYKIPFFKEYPLYLNMSAMLPYYTLNMFTPTDRTYRDTLPDKLVGAIDRSPFFKDPLMQVMLDYVILPSILRDEMPVGSFGQPIYPKDASLGEKAFYTTRALADTVTPGIASYAGLITPDVDIPFTNTSAIELAPGYRWRKIAYGKEGKNAYGMTGKESATSRTLREGAGATGLPIQAPMDLTYLSNELKKGIKSNE